MPSNIADIPCKNGEDYLGVDSYIQALTEFIQNAATPMTIALQGEWGSGKTSLMQMLEENLRNGQKHFFSIWIDTWHYTMFSQDSKNEIISILNEMIRKLCNFDINKPDNPDKSDQSQKLLKSFAHISAIATGNLAGKLLGFGNMGTEIRVEMEKIKNAETAKDDSFTDSDVSVLKNNIRDVIKKITAGTEDKFIFFVDNLDRLEPANAVKILEHLKNIFDIENCIFVLAIDYGVIVKGLKSKFGEMTVANEREFRSYFEKIIQLPFQMPVESYQITSYLIDMLTKIGFLSEDEKKDNKLRDFLTEFSAKSVGRNPRTLKRLVNTLSLIHIITQKLYEKNSSLHFDKRINFALVCIQLAYPVIYNTIQRAPCFPLWDEKVLQEKNSNAIVAESSTQMPETTDGSAPWKYILYRICSSDPYLKTRYYSISGILEKIIEIIRESAKEDQYTEEMFYAYLEQQIKDNMTLSCVTNYHAVPQITEINHSWLLKQHREKFLPAVNERIKDWGKMYCSSGRVQRQILYEVYTKNDNWHFSWLSRGYGWTYFTLRFEQENGKIVLYMTKWQCCFLGNKRQTLQQAETDLRTFGTAQKVLDRCKAVADKYNIECCSGYLNFSGGVYSELGYKFRTVYVSEEEVCSASAIDKYADFFADFLNELKEIRNVEFAANAKWYGALWEKLHRNKLFPVDQLNVSNLNSWSAIFRHKQYNLRFELKYLVEQDQAAITLRSNDGLSKEGPKEFITDYNLNQMLPGQDGSYCFIAGESGINCFIDNLLNITDKLNI